MSAGSGSSNLGYGNINPYNISSYVNGTSSNYSGSFSSNEIPRICMNGGAKKIKRKIKNITKQYKIMKRGSKKMKSIKRRLRSRTMSRTLARQLASRRKTRRRQRGGYAQYMNNLPNTPSYSVAGINLPASQLALANPPPIQVLPKCTNCVDNFSNFSMTGFPSKGH